MTVRTRFAPSPTGNLHVGSVRTALFAWLYARKNNGEFILRIEDTDTERSTEEATDIILKSMAWLGLESDEKPIYQHDRLERYQLVIDKLLDEEKAYRCYCSKERLDEIRTAQMEAKQKPKYDGACREKKLPHREEPYVIRFKTPLDGAVSFKDEVYGPITVQNAELDDLIIQRSDGFPTYNFAVVIDDSDMGITHVIRGDDHLSNTPRQINLFKALNATIPVFAHLSMILGEDGKRLSKRHGAVSVLEFKEQGYLPQALLNYLVRLGWSHGDKEIFSIDEMINEFNLEDVSRGTSAFDYEKLSWLNQHYLKNTPIEALVPLLKPIYEKNDVKLAGGPDLLALIPLLTERSISLNEVVDKSHYFFQDDVSYDEKAIKKHLKPAIVPVLESIVSAYQSLSDWETSPIHEVIIAIAEKYELKMGKVAQPIRVAVTGSTMSPSIDVTLKLIGKERTIRRLTHAIDLASNNIN